MLIRLSDNAISHAQTSQDARIAIENLLTAHREGKHILAMPGNAKWIISDHRISEANRGIARSAISRRSEIDGLRKSLRHYIDVHGIGTSNSIVSSISQTVHVVGIDWFTNSSRVQPSILIGENQNDTSIFILLSRALASRNGLRLGLQVEARGGGGSTTVAEFISACKLGRPVFAAVDSDRAWPDGPLGETARQLLAVEGVLSFQIAYAMECRELENAVSVQAISEAFSSNGECLTPELAAHVLSRRGCAVSLHRHVDLKRGMVGHDLSHCSARLEHEHLEMVCEGTGRSFEPDCKDAPKCKTRLDCVCIFVPGLGDGFLARLVTALEKAGANKLGEWAHFDVNDEARTLAETALAFGCGLPASRV